MTHKMITPRMAKRLLKYMDGVDQDLADTMMMISLEAVLDAVKEGMKGEVNPVYAKIREIMFENKIESCYFCNDHIDPNEQEFNLDKSLCLFCQLKLANILVALDVNPKRLLPLVGERKIQQTRI